MTPADLKAYYERWADPREHGDRDLRDIDAGEAIAAVRKAFGEMPQRPGYAALGALPVPSHDAVTKVEERRDKQQAHFVIGYPGARFTDPDRYALDRAWVGARRDGRAALREPEGQEVAGLLGHLVFLRAGGPGFFAFYMGTSTDKLDGAIVDTLARSPT